MRAYRSSLIIALGLCSVASPAVASDDTTFFEVSLKDLNLTSPADVERLRARLARAATSVCQAHGTKGVHALLSFDACRKDALGKAGVQAERAIAAAGGADPRTVEVARRSTER